MQIDRFDTMAMQIDRHGKILCYSMLYFCQKKLFEHDALIFFKLKYINLNF